MRTFAIDFGMERLKGDSHDDAESGRTNFYTIAMMCESWMVYLIYFRFFTFSELISPL